MSSPFFVHTHARSRRLRLASMTGLACAVLALSHGVAAQPITLAQAQQQAIARSRLIDAHDQATAAARALADAAGQRPDPVLKVGIDNLPVSGADRFSLGSDFMTMRRVGISQELTAADKLHWRAAGQARAADKAQADKALATATIERDTALAWLDVFYTMQMAEAIAGQAILVRQEIEAAEASYRGGRGSQADVLAARAAALAQEDRASDVKRRLRVAQTMLARWTGGAVDVAGAPDIDRIALDPASLASALAHHPQIAVLNRQEDIALADANLARANQHADWSVEVAFQQRGAAYSNMVSVGLSVPLQWDRPHRQDRELAAKLALVEQSRAERDDMLGEHVAQTRALIVEWQSGRERLARYRRATLPLAEEASQAALAAYRGGKASLAEVLAARRNATEIGLQALQLELDTARLWAQLNFLSPDSTAASHAGIDHAQESP